MTAIDRTDDLIRGLTGDLLPVRRLAPPMVRTVLWLAAAAVVAGAAYLWFGGAENTALFAGQPYAIAAMAGALVTAILAALAAFELSLPDRPGAWALLPIPSLIVWIAASGLGCLAGAGGAVSWGSTFAEAKACLQVILAVSIPVSLAALVMLRRASPLQPMPVALMAGLASAAFAGAVLMAIHPHNSSVLDLAVHAVCVLAVIVVSGLAGSRLFKTS